MKTTAVALLSALSSALATPFTTCGADHLGISSVALHPEPVVIGQTLNIDVAGTPDVAVTGGNMHVDISVLGVTIIKLDYNVCADIGLTCPVNAGSPWSGVVTYDVPSNLPPATATAKVTVTDLSGAQLSCISMQIKVVKSSLEASSPVVSQDLVDFINTHATTWEAQIHERFANATRSQASRLMGTILNGDERYVELPAKRYSLTAAAPTDFDARTEWPQCASVIGHIRDQSDCGSCWAFGTTEAFNDRLCIAHGLTTLLSAEDTMACCTGLKCSFSQGCNGGQPSGAWNWFVSEGVVTGGDFGDIGSGSTCSPYQFATCAHHVDPSPGIPACPSTEYSTPSCKTACSEKNYGKAYATDKVKATKSYSLKTVADIQQDLMTNGPVSAALTVYDDFLAYKSGVYQHTTGSALGGHAIKIVGWGVEAGTPYWIIVNSWNDTWGDKGTIKILRGSNECGIEGGVVAGDV